MFDQIPRIYTTFSHQFLLQKSMLLPSYEVNIKVISSCVIEYNLPKVDNLMFTSHESNNCNKEATESGVPIG